MRVCLYRHPATSVASGGNNTIGVAVPNIRSIPQSEDDRSSVNRAIYLSQLLHEVIDFESFHCALPIVFSSGAIGISDFEALCVEGRG